MAIRLYVTEGLPVHMTNNLVDGYYIIIGIIGIDLLKETETLNTVY